MDTQVPLTCDGAAAEGTLVGALLSAVCDRKRACSATKVVPGPSGWFCVHDAATALLCSIHGHKVVVRCAAFSRRIHTTNVFTCAASGTLWDFPDAPGCAKRSECVDVFQTWGNGIQNVGFLKDQLVVGTSGGDLLVVCLPKDAATTPIAGQTVASLPHACTGEPFVWGVHPDTELCVAISTQGFFLCRPTADQPVVTTWQPLSLGWAELSSAAIFQHGMHEKVTVTACSAWEHKVLVLTIGSVSSTAPPQQQEYRLLDTPVDATQFPQASPQCYLHSMSNEPGILLTVVYPDAVIFGTVYDGEMTCSVAVRNELTLALERGCWVRHTFTRTREVFQFAVVRSDGACLLYDLVIEKGQQRFCELVLNGYIKLTHQASVYMAAGQPDGAQDSSFWLSVAPTNELLANAPCAAVRHTVDGDRVPCTVTNYVNSSTQCHVLLMEVVASQSGLALLALLSTGECRIVSQYENTIVGKQSPLEAQTATSIYAFHSVDGLHGVTGHQDGSVTFFVDGVKAAYVHMAHTGPVNQLVLLPACEYGGGDVYDAHVMSVCAAMGTVCLHSSTTGDVVCILCSPSRPLTGCFLDSKSQYMRTFSGEAGNLWHIPTCRLERTFTCAQQGFEKGLENLLHVHSSSLLRMEAVRFLGEVHYSVHIGISSLTASDVAATVDAERSKSRQRDFAVALSLLTRSCHLGYVDDAGVAADRALSTLTGSDVRESSLSEPLQFLSMCVGRDLSGCASWGLFAMLSNLVTKRGDATVTAEAHRLAVSLLASVVRNKTAKEQACLLLGYLSFFSHGNVPAQLPTSMTRFGLQFLVSSVRLVDILPFFDPNSGDNWYLLKSLSAGVFPQLGSATLSAQVLNALVLTLLGSYYESCGTDEKHPHPFVVERQRSDLETAVLHTVNEFERSKEQLGTLDAAQAGLLVQRLLPIAKSLPFVRSFLNEREFTGCVCTAVFNSACSAAANEQIRSSLDQVLQYVASHDIGRFLVDTVQPLYAEKPAWRVPIIVFLTTVVRDFSYAAYKAAAELIEFAIVALAPQAPEKDEKAFCIAAVADFLRVAVATLPNVSFQQSLQQLAVGHRTGEIKVYSLRTATLITTIPAQKDGVMAVSYSSNTASYDIAVISEHMTSLHVWSAARPGNGFTSFLTGYTVHFKHVNQVALPPVKPPETKENVLLPLCTLKWLSPQCIWFISPWHGKIEMSLPQS